MRSKLKRALIGWTTGLGTGYTVLVLALNHFVLSFNEPMTRLTFYLLACGIPVGIISAARSLARVHHGNPRDDYREGTIPIFWGVVLAACIYAISLITR